MEQARTKKRPWLAVVLAALAPAFGHLYLRKWLRGLGWLALTWASTFFVPDATLEALVSGQSFAWLDAAPLLVVTALSVVDAYRLAVLNNYLLKLRTTDGTITVCPNCGREVDDDLAFCQWCAEPLDGEQPEPTRSGLQ